MGYHDLSEADKARYNYRLSLANSHASMYARAVASEDMPMTLMQVAIKMIAEQAMLAEADFDVDCLDFVSDVESDMHWKHGDAIGLVNDELGLVVLPMNLDIVRDVIDTFRSQGRRNQRPNHPSSPDFKPRSDNDSND